MIRFYDTNCLLTLISRGTPPAPGFCISGRTLEEIENIKTSSNKDLELKYNARKLTKWLSEHSGEFEVSNYSFENFGENFKNANYDTMICYDAFMLHNKSFDYRDLVFITNDLSCSNIAKHIYHLDVLQLETEHDDYVGYKIVDSEDRRLADFYTMLNEDIVHDNIFNLLVNEYLLILSPESKQYEIYYWDGNCYEPVSRKNFKSMQFGDVKSYDGDPYQVMAMDCVSRNKLTMLCGPGGSGKSYLALSYLFNQLESGEIDHIVIFCNTVSTKNAARIGFLPGTRNEKLMESSIGNMLASKLGDITEVERLINDKKLAILPMCDIRGFDTGSNVGVYITEAQNMDIELMRLALQRVESGSFVIIDGDHDAQVDMKEFAGENNGMKRLSKIFRGYDFYGEVKLNKIHRSKIAELAQLM